jgi:hypothetical protein
MNAEYEGAVMGDGLTWAQYQLIFCQQDSSNLPVHVFSFEKFKEIAESNKVQLFLLRFYETLNFAQFEPESSSTFTVCRQAATA